jgi:hypothetical protein
LDGEVHGERQSWIQIPGQGRTKVVPLGVSSVEDTKPHQRWHVVTRFDNTGREIKVADILVGCGVAKENPGKVVLIQLASLRSSAFDTYSKTKSLEMCDVLFTTIPSFVGCFFDS